MLVVAEPEVHKEVEQSSSDKAPWYENIAWIQKSKNLTDDINKGPATLKTNSLFYSVQRFIYFIIVQIKRIQ